MTLQAPAPVSDHKTTISSTKGSAVRIVNGSGVSTANRSAVEAPVDTADSSGADNVESTSQKAARYVFAGVRIALGFIFLWGFLDKTFGLGHDTTSKGAWINGGNPTKGFLAKGASGPFTDFYHNIAGAGFTNWLFMLALLGVGVALIAGVGMRAAAVAGGLLVVMMWTVVLPPANNPFLDDHIIYAGVLVALALVSAGDTFGLGRIWSRTSMVKRAPFLK